MKLIKTLDRMQKLSARLKREGHKIAFVPTMGALHEGHLALVKRAKKAGDIVIVSIYVNPAQFGPTEDLAKYPRTFKDDRQKLSNLKVDYLFCPTNDIMYPEGYETYIQVEKMSTVLEGKFRPVFFRGVVTIVTKLFNIVQPDVAIFGQKDYQQSVIVRKLVKDLNIPVKIIVAPTVREESGLAMSSRNRYFNAEQKKRAGVLYRSLQMAKYMIDNGKRNSDTIRKEMRKVINQTPGTRIEYIEMTDNDSLKPLSRLSGKFTISLAVWLDDVRLIDNISVNLKD